MLQMEAMNVRMDFFRNLFNLIKKVICERTTSFPGLHAGIVPSVQVRKAGNEVGERITVARQRILCLEAILQFIFLLKITLYLHERCLSVVTPGAFTVVQIH